MDSFKNWKALLLNMIFTAIMLLITAYFVAYIIENITILAVTNNLSLFAAFGYYITLNPLDIFILILSAIALLLVGALAPTITLNLFEKKSLFSGYWKVVGLLVFVFLLSLLFIVLINVLDFNIWVFVIFFIIAIILWFFLMTRLFFLVPNIVLDDSTFTEAWINAREKVKGKYANVIVILIIFFALMHFIDTLSIALFSFYVSYFWFVIIVSVLAGFLGTWILMTMFHKY